ncbi:MAG: hypothetical protein WC501_03935 [Candidatus Micrarchaeia archaeon]
MTNEAMGTNLSSIFLDFESSWSKSARREKIPQRNEKNKRLKKSGIFKMKFPIRRKRKNANKK